MQMLISVHVVPFHALDVPTYWIFAVYIYEEKKDASTGVLVKEIYYLYIRTKRRFVKDLFAER